MLKLKKQNLWLTYWSTGLLQLTGRCQYDGIAWLALPSATFLMRSATSQSSSYPIVLTRLGGPHSRTNTHFYNSESVGNRTRDHMITIRHAGSRPMRQSIHLKTIPLDCSYQEGHSCQLISAIDLRMNTRRDNVVSITFHQVYHYRIS
jgi:hypothetical protein